MSMIYQTAARIYEYIKPIISTYPSVCKYVSSHYFNSYTRDPVNTSLNIKSPFMYILMLEDLKVRVHKELKYSSHITLKI